MTLAFSRWDYHSDNFKQLREDLPLLDSGLTALITDLHERGLDQDVSVVVWGEFGRTPTINAKREAEGKPQLSQGDFWARRKRVSGKAFCEPIGRSASRLCGL